MRVIYVILTWIDSILILMNDFNDDVMYILIRHSDKSLYTNTSLTRIDAIQILMRRSNDDVIYILIRHSNRILLILIVFHFSLYCYCHFYTFLYFFTTFINCNSRAKMISLVELSLNRCPRWTVSRALPVNYCGIQSHVVMTMTVVRFWLHVNFSW